MDYVISFMIDIPLVVSLICDHIGVALIMRQRMSRNTTNGERKKEVHFVNINNGHYSNGAAVDGM